LAHSVIDIIKTKKINQQSVPRLIQLFIMSLLLNLLMIIFLYLLYINPLEPDYFLTTVNSQVQKLEPLREPNTSDSVVKQWANIATIEAFTYDFVNYEQALVKVSEYFTDDGWYTFLSSLNDTNNLPTVISKKLVVSAVALKPPSILMKGMLNGVYSWRIQIPILVTYQSASEFIQQNVLVNLLVTRISTLENPKGIGIEQFLVSGYLPDPNSRL
jgi:intracellular multiplication protein IcmL